MMNKVVSTNGENINVTNLGEDGKPVSGRYTFEGEKNETNQKTDREKCLSVRAMINSLMEMIDEGTIHLDDRIGYARLLPEEMLSEDKTVTYPKGTLNLLVYTDERSEFDQDVYIYAKNMLG